VCRARGGHQAFSLPQDWGTARVGAIKSPSPSLLRWILRQRSLRLRSGHAGHAQDRPPLKRGAQEGGPVEGGETGMGVHGAASVLLLGSGLMGLAAYARLRLRER
jgi:hypothetical protein